MKILAIDSGLKRCGVVLYAARTHTVRLARVWPPNECLAWVRQLASPHRLVIEHIGHYGTGQPAGRDTFDTCRLIGRLEEAWEQRRGVQNPHLAGLLLRADVKTYLCHKRNATDAMVRRALLDRFPATGGGATPQVGTKGQPGPLYGVKGDAWQALALAITYAETVLELPPLKVEVPA